MEQAGEILNRYEYDPWGNLTTCEERVENRFQFTGQQLDPISQQYYLRARICNLNAFGRDMPICADNSYTPKFLNIVRNYIEL